MRGGEGSVCSGWMLLLRYFGLSGARGLGWDSSDSV